MSLLTPKEMQELTGAKVPSKQIEVLEEHRIGYIKRLNGGPTTTWEAVNARLAGSTALPSSPANDGFDLESLQ
ncbi:DUF4224 domain-containing protein [Pseudomaricurvus alkylphenolicus]|uniref:DUF4224 domain-containing protein n=1 Tax=Pseudomaricurvus alkylphenolicus TaxID=1306991 RepID=UPI0014219942|nr:DUF4224 domain-containing protein [Pseudomaricurvus alkylphenolicus]NIB43753.1 DUF4224 domain-containing protein [Pseudomaricurvus alkylphenolicus]